MQLTCRTCDLNIFAVPWTCMPWPSKFSRTLYRASKFRIECTCSSGKWIVKITCPNVPLTCLKYIKPMQLIWKSEIHSRQLDKSCRYSTSPTVIFTHLRRSDEWNFEHCVLVQVDQRRDHRVSRTMGWLPALISSPAERALSLNEARGMELGSKLFWLPLLGAICPGNLVDGMFCLWKRSCNFPAKKNERINRPTRHIFCFNHTSVSYTSNNIIKMLINNRFEAQTLTWNPTGNSRCYPLSVTCLKHVM